MLNFVIIVAQLRVQDEHFSEEKGFIVRDTEKKQNSFRRDSNPQSMD